MFNAGPGQNSVEKPAMFPNSNLVASKIPPPSSQSSQQSTPFIGFLSQLTDDNTVQQSDSESNSIIPPDFSQKPKILNSFPPSTAPVTTPVSLPSVIGTVPPPTISIPPISQVLSAKPIDDNNSNLSNQIIDALSNKTSANIVATPTIPAIPPNMINNINNVGSIPSINPINPINSGIAANNPGTILPSNSNPIMLNNQNNINLNSIPQANPLININQTTNDINTINNLTNLSSINHLNNINNLNNVNNISNLNNVNNISNVNNMNNISNVNNMNNISNVNNMNNISNVNNMNNANNVNLVNDTIAINNSAAFNLFDSDKEKTSEFSNKTVVNNFSSVGTGKSPTFSVKFHFGTGRCFTSKTNPQKKFEMFTFNNFGYGSNKADNKNEGVDFTDSFIYDANEPKEEFEPNEKKILQIPDTKLYVLTTEEDGKKSFAIIGAGRITITLTEGIHRIVMRQNCLGKCILNTRVYTKVLPKLNGNVIQFIGQNENREISVYRICFQDPEKVTEFYQYLSTINQV
ncbi:hypothetical protein TRFO_17744 [Tritrichomonas foetus]|uniref:RanBD1 domain-containing protein n=1 Tax=Tritrichomonas foetus TaxID=1144522 RepID=A0A1J4KM58_9EUKA|nr:hypothetical protein TRFO_17744 [Tritrichomonas foetus]|eukprot:OHT12385.1 hypothetical protein TRFO_17744 [Tritrichomonas foetus]